MDVPLIWIVLLVVLVLIVLTVANLAAGTRRKKALTRLSHELSATAPDPSASAAFYGAFLAPGA